MNINKFIDKLSYFEINDINPNINDIIVPLTQDHNAIKYNIECNIIIDNTLQINNIKSYINLCDILTNINIYYNDINISNKISLIINDQTINNNNTIIPLFYLSDNNIIIQINNLYFESLTDNIKIIFTCYTLQNSLRMNIKKNYKTIINNDNLIFNL